MNKVLGVKETQTDLKAGGNSCKIFNLNHLNKLGFPDADHLPFSLKILLENALRHFDDDRIKIDDIERIARWDPQDSSGKVIGFKPARVILQDFTGVPCLVDLAAMRSAMKRYGGDIYKINPQIPCDLIIDHSVQVDAAGTHDAFDINLCREFERNQERYRFLKWGQGAFKNFTVVPPATGIIHQINLEYLAKGVICNGNVAYPDTLIGTDSHTTTINGIGVLGWGVGGIEAEAVMLGEPIYMLLPQVVGFRLKGKLPSNITATDLVLTITQMLRQKGVVGKFVEFFGDGLNHLSLPDRATIANMAPEYGATLGLFPVDNETLSYYRMTGRKNEQVDLIEHYMKEQGMFYSQDIPEPKYSDVLELDLNKVAPCLAGHKRPQDRIGLKDMSGTFKKSFAHEKPTSLTLSTGEKIDHGVLAIASITSCTNTSNPSLMIGSGLVAKKAVEKGLRVPSYVKTSFAPGSQVVDEYLKKAGLLPYLETLGFQIVGYGCMTCIGNSGDLKPELAKLIKEKNLIASSVLSGNRNFEGRIHALVKANYLASPMLVVAYALAGKVDIDLEKEPIAKNKDGENVYLKDIWPSKDKIDELTKKYVSTDAFTMKYADVFKGDANWQNVKSATSDLFAWDEKSTYIQEPPFFMDMPEILPSLKPINNTRVLALLGDSITTDHISPAGNIAKESPAGKFLIEKGIEVKDFNTYGSRRGNDQIMTRGTFANIRLKNQLVPGSEGSRTMFFPEDKQTSIYEAAELYKKKNVPLIVLAGKEYGTGSSRDWAAKGTTLLGVKVVLAESFERIHRSNLVGMGILPLQFKAGESISSLGLKGTETFAFPDINDGIRPGQEMSVIALDGDKKCEFSVICRLDTNVEIDYFKNGGILQTVLRRFLKS